MANWPRMGKDPRDLVMRTIEVAEVGRVRTAYRCEMRLSPTKSEFECFDSIPLFSVRSGDDTCLDGEEQQYFCREKSCREEAMWCFWREDDLVTLCSLCVRLSMPSLLRNSQTWSDSKLDGFLRAAHRHKICGSAKVLSGN